MGKTHFSGLAVGDPSIGVYGGAMLCLTYRFAGAAADVPLNLNEAVLIRDVCATTDAGLPHAPTIRIGTTIGGSEILPSAGLVAGTPTTVYKQFGPGPLYLTSSFAGVTNIWITYATKSTPT